MKVVKNIEALLPLSINQIISNSKNTIASKAICTTDHTDIRFFSYAKGESISKEFQEEDSIIYVYQGKLKVLYRQNEEKILSTGEMMVIPSNVEYGIEVLEDAKSFNILVK
ncbi:cupin domain-containing protein [Tindallia californiensis]|uniref:Cupin domain-containing protein n=1 Tax=Tindallia californiensis TaxID=159292 RepID=A0A1H3KBX2_9FIRM|nr:cupin domain-containing protein [Tindallia californiensis]SDY49661.1 Cupin domain-containing protein [Tindallia californiensis]